MSTLKTEFKEQTIYFDKDCDVCVRLVEKYRKSLEEVSFKFVPLQQEGVSEELGIPKEALLKEMLVKTSGGKVIGGAAAVVFLAKHIKSLWPIVLLNKLPFGFSTLNIVYQWFARNRGCKSGHCEIATKGGPHGSVVLLGVVLFALAIEGVICLAMAFPIGIGLGVWGGVVG